MRMIRLAPAFLVLAGCIEDLKTVRLKADGSGTIVYTQRKKEWLVELFQKNALQNEFTEQKAREQGSKLGHDVEFVSMEQANREGWIGSTSTYSFKDASKLKFDDTDSAFHVEKLANGNRKVTVTSRFKRSQNDAKTADSKIPEDLIRALLSGMKFGLALEVDGTIMTCSSPHVAGSVVTVMEVNVDQLFEETARLKKLGDREPATLAEAKETIEALRLLNALQGGDQNAEEASRAMQKMKGIKHALAPQVTLEWTPKK